MTGSVKPQDNPHTSSRDAPLRARNPAIVQTGRRWIKGRLPQVGFVVLFAVVFAIFAIWRTSSFLTVATQESILSTSVVAMLLSTGLVFVLIVRDFDLSIAANAALAGSVAVMLMSSHNVPVIPACIAALLVGIGAGAINGIVVAYFEANALITTLATASVFTGIQEWLTHSQQVSTGIKDGYINITVQEWGGFPAVVIGVLVIAAVMIIILRRTVLGRHAYATGSNISASRLAGVRTRTIRFWCFTIMGGFAGLAGICLTSLGGSTPQAESTNSYLLPAYAAAFLGAITIGRGRFTVGAAVIGVVFTGMLQTGLIIIGAPQFTTTLTTGLVLVAAVLISRATASDLSVQ